MRASRTSALRQALRRLRDAQAITASALHTLTDVMEVAGGGFSPLQLALNYVAFLAIPFVVVGLFVAQRPDIARMGLAGAILYGAAFVYFAGTSVVAFTSRTRTYADLLRDLGVIYTLHGAIMIAGGSIFDRTCLPCCCRSPSQRFEAASSAKPGHLDPLNFNELQRWT